MRPSADPSLGGLRRGFRLLAALAIAGSLIALAWQLLDKGFGGSGPPPPPLVTATFADGLAGWSAAGVGEVLPQVLPGPGLGGQPAARFLLEGEENRSELIFGGDGGTGVTGIREFSEGDEYWYGFAFYVGQMVWGHPGSQNLIMQLKSEGTGAPNLGLQLWDWRGEGGAPGGRGLWSEGAAMSVDGDEHRFLAPVAELDIERFNDPKPPFTRRVDTTSIIDASSALGEGWWLVSVKAVRDHGPPGGQVMAVFVP